MNSIKDSPPAVRASDTSTAAAKAIKPKAGRLRQLVFQRIAAAGEVGRTTYGISDTHEARPGGGSIPTGWPFLRTVS